MIQSLILASEVVAIEQEASAHKEDLIPMIEVEFFVPRRAWVLRLRISLLRRCGSGVVMKAPSISFEISALIADVVEP